MESAEISGSLIYHEQPSLGYKNTVLCCTWKTEKLLDQTLTLRFLASFFFLLSLEKLLKFGTSPFFIHPWIIFVNLKWEAKDECCTGKKTIAITINVPYLVHPFFWPSKYWRGGGGNQNMDYVNKRPSSTTLLRYLFYKLYLSSFVVGSE